MLAALATPTAALADGYNDWAGGVVGPGELYVVPALSVRAAPSGSSGRTLESFPQLQLQVGLGERVDMIIAGATLWTPGAMVHDWIYLQPRIQIVDGLSFSPGLNLQAHADGDPWALSPGLFHTMEPEGWQITWNLIGYFTPRDWSSSSFFLVTVVERVLNDTWSVYGEVDVFHYLSAPGAELNLTLFAGAMINLSDTDTVNVCVFVPTRPELDVAGTGVGLWWSHGFEVQPLR